MEDESNQELLTWEECRQQIIELGKFEFKEGKWISHRGNYYQSIKKDAQLNEYILKYTKSFPKELSLSERMYCILNNMHSYSDHYCPTCSKPLKFRNIFFGYFSYCSVKCAKLSKESQEKSKATMIERYGVDNPSKMPDIKEKRARTYFEKTGYFHNMQNPESLEKRKEFLLKTTGYDHQFKNPKVIHTREETCIKRFGVPNPFMSESVQKDIKKQRFERTGYEHHFSNPDVIQHIQSNRTRNGRVAYSKISQELFWMIYDTIPDELKKHTHFASLNRELGRYDWKEKTGYFYDFIISNIGLCIEFDGDYWHKDSQQRDYYKQRFLEKSEGYIFIRIKEGNFKDNKEDTYKNCIKIIKELSSYLD